MKNKLIDKLNKKDEEELLSRIKEQEDKSYYGHGFSFLNMLCKYTILLLVLIPLWFIAFENGHNYLFITAMSIFLIVAKVIIYGAVFGFLLDYIIFFIRRIKIIRIKKEYFEVIPKRK